MPSPPLYSINLQWFQKSLSSAKKKRKKIKEDATKTIIIARKSILLSLSMCTLSSGVPTCDFFSFDTWQGQSRNFINIALTLTKPRGQVAVILYISSNVK
jgi:hypothetical protein